ncbi:SPFH domain-containing protein [Usitatibacter palustris]|uniref:Band 7 domain-containing protein n=1 Tax=Usitatibacter palustris TaxID=2732487 RepID=A0A6M4H8Q6_9PROT|nr:SPFH domain-containing protein [Usitatibacter palustris]QJR15996.1 hypothetical protein DSM104440_02824 [Usitatibacter palustris]
MIHKLAEHERAVIFTLGRFSGVKGPGWVVLIPAVQTMNRMDIRPVTLDLPNVTVIYRVVDPGKALLAVADFRAAMQTLTETSVKGELAGRGADALVFERKGIEDALKKRLNDAIGAWGLHVESVALKR